jgi:hypothetical protein
MWHAMCEDEGKYSVVHNHLHAYICLAHGLKFSWLHVPNTHAEANNILFGRTVNEVATTNHECMTT